MNIVDSYYWKSFNDLHDLPCSDGEVVFMGRSNVGKSSLLNAVVNKKVSIVSKVPGRTRSINFFATSRPPRTFLVDLPGYGFAKVSKKLLNQWHSLIPMYLNERVAIRMIYILIDARIGITPSDLQALDLILSCRKQYRFILTKADKLSAVERKNIVNTASNDILHALNLCTADSDVSSNQVKMSEDDTLSSRGDDVDANTNQKLKFYTIGKKYFACCVQELRRDITAILNCN